VLTRELGSFGHVGVLVNVEHTPDFVVGPTAATLLVLRLLFFRIHSVSDKL